MDDRELVAIVTEFRDGILDGGRSDWMCFAVCAPLAGYLAAFHGMQAEMTETDLGEMNHLWLRLQDGRALDPTADQFNRLFPDMDLPPVYLGQPLIIHTGLLIGGPVQRGTPGDNMERRST